MSEIQKKLWGGGTAPSPDPTPVGRGTPPPHTPYPSAPSALDLGAFGASILPFVQ